MALVILSIGSNVQPMQNITACLDALLQTFGDMSVSRVYESQPVGLRHGQASANFYNLVVALASDWPVGQLQTYLKALEKKHGRQQDSQDMHSKQDKQTSIVQPLDLDLLSVGQLTGCHDGVELPRRDILHHAFVLRPLAELLPAQRHPLTQRRYAELWRDFNAATQPLWPVAFAWRFKLPHFSARSC